MGVMARLDDFILDSVCAPTARRASLARGLTHMDLSAECVRVGGGLMLTSYALTLLERTIVSFAVGLWLALSAVMIAFLMAVLLVRARMTSASENDAAARRVSERGGRYFLMAVVIFNVILEGLSALAGRHELSDFVNNLGFSILVLESFYRASGTPPPDVSLKPVTV